VNRNHVCGPDSKYCYNCRLEVSTAHRCYVKCDNKKDKKFKGYIFFDYEARVNNGIHEPNLIIAKKVCDDCIDEAKNDCEKCCKKIFESNDDFCCWLYAQHNCIALAHNLKGYDGVFILNHILNKFLTIDKLPKVLMNGTKILSIES
jgi:hypothetical protein